MDHHAPIEAGAPETPGQPCGLDKGGARAVRHLGHGEVMHPGVGPWEEANGLYVTQTRLTAKLEAAGTGPLRILDVGLGAGANAIAALTAATSMGERLKRTMEIVSLERDRTPLMLALGDAAGFPFLTPWKGQLETLLRHGEVHQGDFLWRLLEGDATERLAELHAPFHIVFQDPFSPDNNPLLWTADWFRRVRALEGPEGLVLSTYSTSTPVRVSLLVAGFHVGAGAPSGARAETTVAASRGGLLENPLGRRWLERWERSSARAPIGGVLDADVERAVREHPQFKT